MCREEHEAMSPYHGFSMYKFYKLLRACGSGATREEDAFDSNGLISEHSKFSMNSTGLVPVRNRSGIIQHDCMHVN